MFFCVNDMITMIKETVDKMFYLNSSEPFSFTHEQGSSNAQIEMFIDDD